MKASDLPLLTSVSRPTIHPDGTLAVFATTSPNLEADASVGQLWRVPLDGGTPPVRLTRGFSDRAPRFSPDGTQIAFLRSDGEHPSQLQVMSAAGGEPAPATDEKLGVSFFNWAPDSASLVYTARVAEEGRYGTVKDLVASAEPPRRIVTRKYQHNGLGYTNDRRTHVFLVDAPDPSGEPTYRVAASVADPTPETRSGVPQSQQLTSGDFDNDCPQFSPQGDHIAFISARHDSRDIDLANNIYEISLASIDKTPVPLLDDGQKYGVDGFVYAKDNSVYFVGSNLGEGGRDFVGRNGVLHRVDREKGSTTRLTDPESSDLSEGAVDMQLAPDGNVLALNRWRGNVHLVSVSRDGDITEVVGGSVVVGGFDTSGDRTVISYSDASTMGDVAVISHSGLRPISNFSVPLQAVGISPIVELLVDARDGQSLQGWVLTPRGEGPHPVLLNIHGGPYSQYTGSFFDEAQVYVDAGYAVVMCNPRGAAGYGEAFGRSIQHRMGTLDYTDVLDYLDGALNANSSFDSARVGIMGGSYGGYLTAWTISQNHRFAAAIVERGFLDPETFIGTSDIGDFFGDEYTGTDPDQVRAQSPQAFVHQVTTPTLVLHSENDLRCPLSQGQRYFLALKRQGVDTELLIFPGEDHELSRGGRPRHRLQRFEAVLDWWQRYLPVNS